MAYNNKSQVGPQRPNEGRDSKVSIGVQRGDQSIGVQRGDQSINVVPGNQSLVIQQQQATLPMLDFQRAGHNAYIRKQGIGIKKADAINFSKDGRISVGNTLNDNPNTDYSTKTIDDGDDITDAIIIAIPIITAPIIIPSEIFWSSSISFFIENGVNKLIIRKPIAIIIIPTIEYITVSSIP